MPQLIKIDEQNKIISSGIKSVLITEGVGAEVKFFPQTARVYTNDTFSDDVFLSPASNNKKEMILFVSANNTHAIELLNWGENWNVWVVAKFLGDGQVGVLYDVSTYNIKTARFQDVSYSFLGVSRRQGVNFLEQKRGEVVNYSIALSVEDNRRGTDFLRFYVRKEVKFGLNLIGIRIWKGDKAWGVEGYDQYSTSLFPSPDLNKIGVLYQNVEIYDLYVR